MSTHNSHCGGRVTLRRTFLLGLTALGAALGSAEGRAADTPPPRPNIVYFLADDLGWADVGWHGGEIKTPNLDKLAAAGARLEQFYVQPVCSPTRAALLTGRYPMRHGLQVGVVRPWAQYGLPLEERTLPQALKEAGYETAIAASGTSATSSPSTCRLAAGLTTSTAITTGRSTTSPTCATADSTGTATTAPAATRATARTCSPARP